MICGLKFWETSLFMIITSHWTFRMRWEALSILLLLILLIWYDCWTEDSLLIPLIVNICGINSCITFQSEECLCKTLGTVKWLRNKSSKAPTLLLTGMRSSTKRRKYPNTLNVIAKPANESLTVDVCTNSQEQKWKRLHWEKQTFAQFNSGHSTPVSWQTSSCCTLTNHHRNALEVGTVRCDWVSKFCCIVCVWNKQFLPGQGPLLSFFCQFYGHPIELNPLESLSTPSTSKVKVYHKLSCPTICFDATDLKHLLKESRVSSERML